MPAYKYKARDEKGMLVAGESDSSDERSVAQGLKRLGYSVIEIKETSGASPLLGEIHFRWRKKVRPEEIIFLTRQLQTMLKSGISLTTALISVADQTKGSELREITNNVRSDVESGKKFSEGLARYPEIFSENFVSMIRVGEATGGLDEVLGRLTKLNTQELDVRTRIKSALTYPIILVVAAIIVVSFLLINILPKFVLIFETYDVKLPMATRVLLGVSYFVKRLWYVLILAIGGFIFWFRRFVSSEEGRYKAHFFLLHIPLFGELYRKTIISRFVRNLAAMTRSGVAILEALLISARATPNQVLKSVIQRIHIAVGKGEGLADTFRKSEIFPEMVIQMVSVGEKTGRLDEMLVDVADFYDQETENTIKSITVVVEPLLLLAMGLTVAFIAMAVLLPIFNLIRVFRQ